MRAVVFVLLASLVVAAFAACGSSGATELAPTADAASEAAPVDAGVDAAEAGFPILPYPAGPYGLAPGETMPDLVIQGYRMSRTQRDSTKLPFENISLSEVRSDPSCQCLLLVYNPAGTGCNPCVEMDQAVSALVAKNPSLCAAEIVPFNFDVKQPQDAGPVEAYVPPTRADLDFVTQAAREPFPVGLPTTSVLQQPFRAIPLIPDVFVMHPGDMRIADFLEGTGNLDQRVRDACTTPYPAVATLASGVSSSSIAYDDIYVYVADKSKGLRRVAKDGSSDVTILADAGIVALRVDGAYVYVATGSSVLRVPRAGGAPETVTTAASPVTSMALDIDDVWFTAGDLIAHAPKVGGAPVTFTTDTAPRSVALDETAIYWTSAGVLVGQPRTGGARAVLLQQSDVKDADLPGLVLTFEEVQSAGVEILGRFTTNFDGGGVIHRPKDGGAPAPFNIFPPVRVFTLAPVEGAYAGLYFDGIGGLVARLDGPQGARVVHSIGSQPATAIAVDGRYIFWVEGDRLRRARLP